MPDRFYEETEWLPAIIIGGMAVCFVIAALLLRQLPILFPAGLMALMAVTLFWRVTVTFDELSVRFGIWGITAARVARIEAQSAEAFGRKWDGVNWPVRRISDVVAQGGGKELGVLIRSTKGDFWIQSRRPEDLARALTTAWSLHSNSGT
ncbi:MAG: hypothetical protein FJX75_15920 [Armatimonadetes bacterium]|nr:hypothetical protein [Armatimonadota bacterium]